MLMPWLLSRQCRAQDMLKTFVHHHSDQVLQWKNKSKYNFGHAGMTPQDSKHSVVYENMIAMVALVEKNCFYDHAELSRVRAANDSPIDSEAVPSLEVANSEPILDHIDSWGDGSLPSQTPGNGHPENPVRVDIKAGRFAISVLMGSEVGVLDDGRRNSSAIVHMLVKHGHNEPLNFHIESTISILDTSLLLETENFLRDSEELVEPVIFNFHVIELFPGNGSVGS
ncbi:hypothetical protein B0H10DRAFT_1954532 [Mycena sp. CBHHK59/15]|nr:hypothetical protein B0H10DRAFT_1954532 [Mycena sp. CBHHK59/15]